MSGDRTIVAPRLVLGPRRGGRDFGLLAVSQGVQISSPVSARLLQFLFDVREFVLPERPVHGFFRLDRAIWLLSTTSRHGEDRGNPIWVTSGVLLTGAQTAAIDGWLVPLLTPWEQREPPPPDSIVPPLTRAVPRPPAPASEDEEAFRLASAIEEAPVVCEIEEGADATARLAAVLAACPRARRLNASFLTAPPALESLPQPTLSIYPSDLRRGLGPLALERLRLAEERQSIPPTRAAGAWTALVQALDPIDPALSVNIEPWPRGGQIGPDVSAPYVIQQRVDGFLRAEYASDTDRMFPLLAMMRAATAVTGDNHRETLLSGLILSFQTAVIASVNPGLWLDAFDREVSPLLGAQAYRAMVIRLAIDSGALLSWSAERIAAAAPNAIPIFTARLIDRLERTADVAVPVILALFERVLDVLRAGEGTDGEWRLGSLLLEHLGRSEATPSDVRRAIELWITQSVRAESVTALNALHRAGLWDEGRAAFTGLTTRKRNAAIRAASRDLSTPDNLAYALAMWKLAA